MDNANDGDLDGIIEIYEASKDKKGLLNYKNQRAASTALHLAANNGHAEIVKYLVDCICKDFAESREELINKENKFGFTPLMSACFRGYFTKGKKQDAEDDRLEIVKCLVANGARAGYTTKDTKMTAAHWASYNKDHNVVKELLKNEASEFTFSHMGRLPIDVAGSTLAYQVIDVFLDHYYEKLQIQPSHRTGQEDNL